MTERKGKPLRNMSIPRSKRIIKRLDPKPCPTCWNDMRQVEAGVWECPKHGRATRP